jgi:G6PDH family F420-dependent oxidoreductase
MRIGYFLSSEEWGPRDLVELAGKSQQAGFDGLWISDHYHPWNDEQGHSPFVWSVIGAIAVAAPGAKLTTAVTCPTIRMHPGIVAQEAATSAILLDGRFCLGLGSGKALNEHIFGDRWPGADERLEMLEEAVEVIRKLWEGGVANHEGRHYRLDHCRVYDMSESPPPIVISGFDAKSVALAAKIDDGYCTVGPDAESVAEFRSNALVTEDTLAEQLPCGPDLDQYVEAINAYADAGFDELYIQQIGPEQDEFFRVYAEDVLPRVSSQSRAAA